MPEEKKDWALKTGDDVAGALDWVRRRMGTSGFLVVAVGLNSVAYAKDPKLSPKDAVEMLEAQLKMLRQGFHTIESQRVTRGCGKREDAGQ